MLGLDDKMIYQFTTLLNIYIATILQGQLLVLPQDITTIGFLINNHQKCGYNNYMGGEKSLKLVKNYIPLQLYKLSNQDKTNLHAM